MSDNSSGAEQSVLPPNRATAELNSTPQFLTSTLLSSSQQASASTPPPLTQLSTTNSSIPTTSTLSRVINISNLRQATCVSSTPHIVSALRNPQMKHTVQTQLFPALTTGSSSLPTTTFVTAATKGNISITSTATTSTIPSSRKRRLDELPSDCENLFGNRARVMEHKWARNRCKKESYYECVAEFYFLETYGNMMDYFMWRKRPRTAHYEAFVRQHQLEAPVTPVAPSETDSTKPTTVEPATEQSKTFIEDVVASAAAAATAAAKEIVAARENAASRFSTQKSVEKSPKTDISPLVVTTARSQQQRVNVTPLRIPVTTTVPSLHQKIQSAPPVLVPVSSSDQKSSTTVVPESVPTVTKTSVVSSSSSSSSIVNVISSTTPLKQHTTSVSSLNKIKNSAISSSACTTNQEQIVEKAKQEAYVMQRVAELQKEGLWSDKRLPKVQEIQRCKSHWDYVLEEMVWLAADFAQERKWKKAAAKKCARMVQKYFQDKALAVQKEQKAQELQLKRIASFLAKEVKGFWSSIEKLVEFKQKTRLEEKRKQALDQQLSFIVDQTEKYSQLLAEGMNKTGTSINDKSVPNSANNSQIDLHHSDDEFQPDENQSTTDDEETIALAEATEEIEKQSEEVAALQRESNLPLEDLLNQLPKDYLENRDKVLCSDLSENELDESKQSSSENSDSDINTENKNKSKKDKDFQIEDEDSEDDEDTINEQEKAEGNVDHKEELNDLQAENEMSIEELRKKYANLPPPVSTDSEDSKHTVNETDDESIVEEQDEDDESEESENEGSIEDEERDTKDGVQSDEEKFGLKMLVEDDKVKTEDDDHLINDAAALAESIQPKGNTFASTSVVTRVPFLLKYPLREYQHIGLDWLVTMYERKLNGILADEMGLGKTIQTIALLAHLACEKSDWGPHLIIVPTSVMLNWEMECKKWCPGFKILTYYGTQKERKLKRIGWTKPNAFHICITSYKLVIQDHQSFRRKKWKYLILDEAQNIKNFKSQRWQLLLNFQTQQRLLLTGTPLQNNLMELWSLMHFLMPHVFQSHREFKEWFSNPVTGMIEGNSEYNESIIKRLHKVLRPFLLRRLKSEVEKQMPKKFEHIVLCRLSKRQRFLYDDYMSRAKTKETLATGNLLSVINVLMQLRKVCNHPNLFEVRPTISPFQSEGLEYTIPSLVYNLFEYNIFENINLDTLYLRIINMEFTLSAYMAYRICKYRAPKKMIELIDENPPPPPPCPKGLIQMRVKLGEPKTNASQHQKSPVTTMQPKVQNSPTLKIATSPLQTTTSTGVKLRVAGPSGNTLQGYSVQFVSHQGNVKAIPVALSSSTPTTLNLATVAGGVLKTTNDQKVSIPTGFAQLVQTPLGKHILLTQNTTLPQSTVAGTTTVMTTGGQRFTVLSKPVVAAATSVTNVVNKTTAVNSTTAISTPATNVTSTKQVNVGLTDSLLESTQAANDALAAGLTITRPLTASLIQHLRNTGTLTYSTSNQNFQTHNRQSLSSNEAKPVYGKKKAIFKERFDQCRQSKLATLYRINEWRCHASPMYGWDLREVITTKTRSNRDCDTWVGGYLVLNRVSSQQNTTDYIDTEIEDLTKSIVAKQPQLTRSVLHDLVKGIPSRFENMREICSRFVFCVPPVSAKPLSYRVLKPSVSKYWGEKRDENIFVKKLSPLTTLYHPIASAMCTQFPDPRLIQYDCGKLQTLDLLLRRLKSDGHRVLIFTQMTKMLDVLEAFLNFHGHIYLRLDGTTKVDQRQVLMERFNGNPKIFAFILSTRSGGVGVNLTGADTVIFYDSDWNPTMDAQAQDRCHRIGQTRDVHIYRLISEKTIEENILKKANQKRMLGDLAIEGGNFTTAYFKSTTIQDLFNVDTNEDDVNARMSEILNKSKCLLNTTESSEDRVAQSVLENALAACEDDQDVLAAKTAKAEAVADLAEFDESIPLEEQEKDPEISKAEQELQNIVKQLTPVERYAMRFIEDTEAAWSAEQLAAVDRQMEEQKREWEENRLAVERQEEDRRNRQQQEDDEMLTFSREDSTNQIWLSSNNQEKMPIWCPPSPPTQDTDVYIDYSMGFLYEMSVMSESQLPPVYVRKEPKRNRHDAGLPLDNRRTIKLSRKEEILYEPRSLFDRPSPELVKMRREIKQQRYKGVIRPQLPKFYPKLPQTSKPQIEPPLWHNWMIHEDMALLKVVKYFQNIHLNLTVLYPAHTPNWDFAADYVNSVSITYRSPKQCKYRYETVLMAREEGKIIYDTSSRKKKNKNMYTKHPQQFKTNRPMRTAQLYSQDNNNSFTQLTNQRFDALKQISNNKRTPPPKAPLNTSHAKNSKHAAVLTEYGIDYDHPLTPVDVAARRAERIAREKQKLGSTEQQRQSTKSSSAITVSQNASLVSSSPSTSQTLTASSNSTGVAIATTAVLQQQQQQTLIVTSQPQTQSAVVAANVAAVQAAAVQSGNVANATVVPTANALRTQRIVSNTIQPGTVTNVAGLTQTHLAQRLIVTGQPVVSKTTVVPTTGTVAVATTKAYTPAQLNFYRQQMLKQQQLRVQNVKNVAIAGQQTVQVAVTQTQPRTQFVKQQAITVATAGGQTKQGITRHMSETEMAALLKQRHQLQQQKLAVVQTSSAASGTAAQLAQTAGTVQTLTQAQLLAQASIQVQQAGTSGTQVATLVKAVAASPGGNTAVTIPVTGVTLGPQVKAAIAAAAQQQQQQTGKATTTLQAGQLRQLQIHQHLLTQKKLAGQKITQLAQVTGKAGVATQLIVQAPKTIPATMTMQQLQQVMRGPQLAVSQGGQVVLTTKSPAGNQGQSQGGISTSGATTRVIPVNAAGQAQQIKQTIQVVTATSAGQATLVRPQVSVSNNLQGALAGTIKVASTSQQALLSQVSAALQGQQMSVRQSGSPVRIQTASGTPLVAVSVQSAAQASSAEQVGVSRLQKK